MTAPFAYVTGEGLPDRPSRLHGITARSDLPLRVTSFEALHVTFVLFVYQDPRLYVAKNT